MKISQIRDPFSAVTSSGSGRMVAIVLLLFLAGGFAYYYFNQDKLKFN
ncbi:MAG: hypothetical protein NTZ69_09910 [Bacteroidia bacterium]|nr:hypothetical protein [Bacteroidia bacterium]